MYVYTHIYIYSHTYIYACIHMYIYLHVQGYCTGNIVLHLKTLYLKRRLSLKWTEDDLVPKFKKQTNMT